jgi:hypothetical protein
VIRTSTKPRSSMVCTAGEIFGWFRRSPPRQVRRNSRPRSSGIRRIDGTARDAADRAQARQRGLGRASRNCSCRPCCSVEAAETGRVLVQQGISRDLGHHHWEEKIFPGEKYGIISVSAEVAPGVMGPWPSLARCRGYATQKGEIVAHDFDSQTPEQPSKTEAVPIIPLSELDALAVAEAWLAPICTRVRELITSGSGNSHLARESLRYIAESLPANKAQPWRALLEEWPAQQPRSGRDQP